MEPTDSKGAESSTATEVTQDKSDKAGSQPAAPAGGEKPSQDGSAASSPAKAEPSSPVDAMKQAMAVMDAANAERTGAKQPNEAGSPAQEASGKDGDAKPQGEGDGKGDAGDGKDAEKDKGKEVNPKTEARFRELTGKLEEAKPKVRNWDSMQTYINASGWQSPQAFADFLEFGKLANLEPHNAIPVLEKTLEALKRRVGEAGELPADIQKRLNDGQIDEISARELASMRGRSQFVEQRTEQQRQQDTLVKQRETHERVVHSIADSITKAEKAWQASDPDYQKLQPFVMDKVLVLLNQKGAEVRTQEDAQKLFDEALSAIRTQSSTLRGPGREIRPMNNGSGGKVAVPDPQNAHEAIKQAYTGANAVS